MTTLCQVSCPPGHSAASHLLLHPCCQYMSRNQRIVSVTLTVLTLCIPLIVERIVRGLIELCKDIGANRRSKNDFREALLDSTLSQPEQRLLQEANNIFSSYFFVPRKKFERGPGVFYDQPLNQTILLLNHIFYQKRQQLKREIFNVQTRNDNPWTDQNIIAKADDMISLAFAIEYFMIKELDAFTSHYHISQGNAFASASSYHFKAIAYLPFSYEMQRDRWIVAETGVTERAAGVPQYIFRQSEIPSAHEQPFYASRCSRLQETLDIESIRAADPRLLLHINPTSRTTQSPQMWF